MNNSSIDTNPTIATAGGASPEPTAPKKEATAATGSIHLQSIGRVRSIAAKDVEVGMHWMFNYGETYEVVGVKQVSKQYLAFTFRDRKGKVWPEYRKRMDTQVASYWPRQK